MFLVASVVRRGASMMVAPRRWLAEKPAAFQSHGQFRRRTFSSLSLSFPPASRFFASYSRLHSSHVRELSFSLRKQGPSLYQSHSPKAATSADGGGASLASGRASSSSRVCHSSSPYHSSTSCINPSFSRVPSLFRFFASKTPASSTPPPPAPAPGAPSSQPVPVQAEEKQIAHAVDTTDDDESRSYYGIKAEHHGDPRDNVDPDGTLKFQTTAESFHWVHPFVGTPAQQFVSVNGKKMIKGVETRDFVELFQIYQKNTPFWPRDRLLTFGNHDLLMKAEFLFFWIPTFIIWSLAVPAFTLIYMSDEAVYSTMTVKVIGRQWYWVYEVESPVDEEE